MNCKHKFVKLCDRPILTIWERLMFWRHYFLHNYSKCISCGVIRHDVDGDILNE